MSFKNVMQSISFGLIFNLSISTRISSTKIRGGLFELKDVGPIQLAENVVPGCPLFDAI